MLLAACFGSVGKMQTMDTICNHGGNYVDVLLRQFGVGVQKPGKTVHYKNQDGTDIFILGRLDIVTFDFFQNGIPQMLRKAVHRGYRNHTEVIRCLLESSKHFLHKGLRFIQQLLCAAHIVADELDCLPLHFGGECIQRFIVGIKGRFVDLGAFGNFLDRDLFNGLLPQQVDKRFLNGTLRFLRTSLQIASRLAGFEVE